MANPTLTASKREGTGKGAARKLRQGGRVPAVLYGRDLDSVHLSVDAREAEHLFHSISVDNTIVQLEVAGEKEAYPTLVREIQTHPWKATLLHIDFLRIQEGVEVDFDVPVRLIGVPDGVKNDGGVLEQTIHDLPVRCVPSKIPESIDVDVTGLGLNDVLHIYDIVLDEGIEVRIPGERTICSVAVPRVIEEPKPEELELVEGEELPEEVEAAAEEGEETGEEGSEEPGGDAD
jgi:large subunit ribosomal protein L25